MALWKKISSDDYKLNERVSIVRMPAWTNGYSNQDEWTLIVDGQGGDVYALLRDAKAAGELELAEREEVQSTVEPQIFPEGYYRRQSY